ncbi:hypothetical protein I5U90_07955 [Stenotrophomonas maltophilia]|nr:hypothetical protein [Stenotrophomonas maltophilia]
MAEKQPNRRGAKPLAQAEPASQDLDAGNLVQRNQELQVLAQAEAQVKTLATTLGYVGALDTDSLWSMVEYRQRRSVEDVLEMGRGLLLIKEQTAHGEFQQQAQARGIHPRMAQKFMTVALKFSKSDSKSLLAAAGTQTKVLELAVLDDEELEALDSGESVAGITLDDVERMSASQLRQALRETRADADAKDQRITKLSDDLNKAEEKTAKAQRKWKKATPDEQSQELLTQLEQAASQVRIAIASGSEEAGFSGAVIALMQHAEQHGLNVEEQVAGLIASLINDLRLVRDHQEVGVTVIHDRHLADWKREG